MYIPKRYGQSKVDRCPFCEKQAVTQNSQKVPVCLAHVARPLPSMRCMCGDVLDMLHGKYGVFFSCIKHGNMNLRKALEINPPIVGQATSSAPSRASPSSKGREDGAQLKKERKETVVTSDELDWMF